MNFEITEKQLESIGSWDGNHECPIKSRHGTNKYCGAVGGRLSYEFIPTSIGTIGTVKCSCGKTHTFAEL